MALIKESQLRSIAKARTTRAYDSMSDALRETVIKSAGLKSFDIFLSHSFLDKELILGMSEYLENLGYVVYVDWKQDSQLSRENVTKETAEVLRNRISQCKSLFFATTTSAKDSKWMPWELGFMDGKKGKSAILPIASVGANSDAYKGQEYLGVYPYITGSADTKGKDRLWVHEDEDTYVSYEAWLNGKEPYRRD